VSRDKTLALIGVPDHEAAHLRLLTRKGASDLDHCWLWGAENGADLLVIDSRSFAGQMARTRAQGAGVRYAIFSDERVQGSDLVLRRPLLLANVVAVLNQAGSEVARNPEIESNSADFYTRDVGDDLADMPQARLGAGFDHANAARGLDDVLRAQPIELRTVQDRTRPPVAVPGTNAASVSSPGEFPADPKAPSSTPAGMPRARKYTTRAAMLADTTPFALRAYLEDGLLRGPARYALPGMPPLVLDPKHKVAHSPIGLGALEPYCRLRWRLCDWQPLTSAGLTEVRATQRALPYARLRWLDVLLHSGGQLASHLDPGGTYRLEHWVEINHDFSRYFRIASAMLQPARLHEIAAASGARMADVFDVVNAYDAIGLIEWQPRPRRDDGARAPSLLGKLRHSFGKS
jgi:hypothetical protein